MELSSSMKDDEIIQKLDAFNDKVSLIWQFDEEK